MYLVNEKYHFALTINDFLHDALQTFLELPLILGTCDQSSQVKRVDLTAFKVFRNITVNYLLGYSFRDGCLADSRLTHKYRIVLGSSAENLKHPPYLFIPSYYRIKFPLCCPLVKIDSKPAEIFKLVVCHNIILYLFDISRSRRRLM